MENCPCGSLKNYATCCEIFITGKKPAPTPEALMRSRYTAYTKANIDYIKRTMQGPALKGFDELHAKQWASEVTWLGLRVKHSSEKNNRGWVEFFARYAMNHEGHEIHELSEFERINEQWYYTN